MRNSGIFIAESDRDTRVSLQMLLDRQPGLQVVGVAVRSAGLVKQVKAVKPDILLMDWELVTSAPEAYLRKLKSVESQPAIIVFHVRPEIREGARAAGADCFICKDSPPDQLLACLQKLKQEKTTHFMKTSNSDDESESKGKK